MKHKGFRKRYKHVEWGHWMYATNKALDDPGMVETLHAAIIWALKEDAQENRAKVKPGSIEFQSSKGMLNELGAVFGRCIFLAPKNFKENQ